MDRTWVTFSVMLVVALTLGCGDSHKSPTSSAQADGGSVADAGSLEDSGSSDVGSETSDATFEGSDVVTEDTGSDGAQTSDGGSDDPVYETAFADVTFSYQTDYPLGANIERELTVRFHYPLGTTEPIPLVVVSHGGNGSTTGHQRFRHIAEAFASRGYVTAHVGHRSSTTEVHHRWDRPHDVSATLDLLAARQERGNLPVTIDFSKVGHLGHSWGAYTANALAGATLEDPTGQSESWTFREERILAIVTLSPQGWDAFGSYDEEHDIERPSDENSWMSVNVPTFGMIGALEMDGVAGIEQGLEGTYRTDKWRLFPFTRYPGGRHYVSILPGQTHSDMGGGASELVNHYVAVNARVFFDVYLRGLEAEEPQIGAVDSIENIVTMRR